MLTDFWLQQRHDHQTLARLAIAGGADTIQFRQKHGAPRHWLPAVRRVVALCSEEDVPVIIDDSLPVVMATGADGVHLGQTDFPIDEARRVLEPHVLVGATATTADQARAAEADGADYVGFGPVFPTRSKENPAPVKGLHGLAEACAAVSIPVVAIGGITPERVAAVLDAGAHGVAVLSYVSLADDPTAATRRVRRAIEAATRS